MIMLALPVSSSAHAENNQFTETQIEKLAILVPNLKGRSSGWTPWNYKGEKKTRHAVKIQYDDKNNPIGWTAEVFIPYRLLSPLSNTPPKKGTQCG